MKPIPRLFLTDTAELIKQGTADLWDEKIINNILYLQHILVVPTKKLSADKRNNQVREEAVMYYDCLNSRPQNVEFEAEDRIRHRGIDYRIISVKTFAVGGKLHHLELGLAL